MKLLKLSVLVCSAFLVFASGCGGEPSVSEEDKKEAQAEMQKTMNMQLPQNPTKGGAPGGAPPGGAAPAETPPK